MHLPGYIQGGQEASYGYLLLGVYDRNSTSSTRTKAILNLKIKTAPISEFTYSKYRHFYLSVLHVTWKLHCKENYIYVFLSREFRGLSSNFHIHVSVSDLQEVLLHNGGFYNACTMKRCLLRTVDFKTNALNNAHVSQLLPYYIL